jgi:lysophospholipid acyltransferase (LPLAT)-like uncharacterized protein
MLKRLIRHPRTQAVFVAVLAGYLRLVYRTTRWTLLGADHIPAALLAPDGTPRGCIIGFWHERLALMPMLWRLVRASPEAAAVRGIATRQPHVLISGHRDGRLIAEVIARLGLRTVVGSTSRDGAAGAIGLMRLMLAGEYVAITPDGPRGPRRRAAAGVAQVAGLTRLPVVPAAAATTRHRLFNSWDRFMLPLPFGRGVVVIGAPIMVPKREAEAMLPAIEAALTAACEAADAWVAAQ